MSIQNPDVYSKKIAEKFSEFYLRKLFRSVFAPVSKISQIVVSIGHWAKCPDPACISRNIRTAVP